MISSLRLQNHSPAALLCCALFAATIFSTAPLAAETSEGQKTDTADTADTTEAPKNTLKWSTASEVDNFGYDVYRGDREEGPFTRITKDPIPGNGTTDETSKYEFVDADIDPTRAYYYYVESISINGERERFTPIFKAKAKQPPADSEQEEGKGKGDE